MTPLFRKLNLGIHQSMLVLNVPGSFDPELAQLAGIEIIRSASKKSAVQFAIGFAITQEELNRLSARFAQIISGDAIVWVAYPKGTSKKYRCEFNRDTGWEVLGEAGFESVRQVAIDEDWSVLSFRRTEHIKSLTRSKDMAIARRLAPQQRDQLSDMLMEDKCDDLAAEYDNALRIFDYAQLDIDSDMTEDEAGDFDGAIDVTLRPTEGVQAFGILKEFGVIE